MKKGVLLASALFALASCGGGTSGVGGQSAGFYNLVLQLSQSDITSPAVAGTLSSPAIPPDTFSGTLRLTYTGSGTGMRGLIQRAELCIEGGDCYVIPATGVLLPNGNINFSIEFYDHKLKSPWIDINPYEDVVVNTTTQTSILSAGASDKTANFSYANTGMNLSLLPPVAPNSVVVKTSPGGTYMGEVQRSNYTSGNNVSFTFDRGINSANAYTFARVYIGQSLACDYNYGTNTLTSYGSFTCSYTPTPNGVNLSVSGFSGSQTLKVEYEFQGILECRDDGNGGFIYDCDGGSINYSSGAISGLKFKFRALNTPQAGTVDYLSGGLGGNTASFVLPPITQDGFIRTIPGRLIEVINAGNNAVLCNNQGLSTGCSLTVSGSRVNVSFPAAPNFPINIRYTLDRRVDFNPALDLSNAPRLSSATVNGFVRVKVRLESGEQLTAEAPIRFRVVPR